MLWFGSSKLWSMPPTLLRFFAFFCSRILIAASQISPSGAVWLRVCGLRNNGSSSSMYVSWTSSTRASDLSFLSLLRTEDRLRKLRIPSFCAHRGLSIGGYRACSVPFAWWRIESLTGQVSKEMVYSFMNPPRVSFSSEGRQESLYSFVVASCGFEDMNFDLKNGRVCDRFSSNWLGRSLSAFPMRLSCSRSLLVKCFNTVKELRLVLS